MHVTSMDPCTSIARSRSAQLHARLPLSASISPTSTTRSLHIFTPHPIIAACRFPHPTNTSTMNLFGGKSGIKPRPANVRVVAAPVVKKPAPLPSKLASSRALERNAPSRSSPSSAGTSRTGTPNSENYDSKRLKPPTKRSAATRKASPNIHAQPKWGDDDDNSSADDGDSNKRRRVENGVNGSVDLKRKLRSRKAFSNDDEDRGKFVMIHAADTTAVPRKTSTIPSSATIEDITVKLRYPSASQREMYAIHLSLTFVGFRLTI